MLSTDYDYAVRNKYEPCFVSLYELCKLKLAGVLKLETIDRKRNTVQ